MAGGFSDRVVEAVGACTRALSGVAYAGAALREAPGGTIGALRAHGDRLALRARFHDAALHARRQPSDPRAAVLFDSLEQARLDGLGARWLAGVAANLIAHPGAEDDAARWLAFEACSGHRAPPNKAASIAHLRSRLPVGLVSGLAELANLTGDQGRFAEAAARWAEAAWRLVSSTDTSRPRLPFQLNRAVASRTLPTRGDPGGTRAPLKPRQDVNDVEGSGSSGTVTTRGRAGAPDYRPYTTAYDRVVNATTLAGRAELGELHRKLEAELSAIRPVVSRLAKRLLRVLMARQVRHWRFDLEEGVLDGGRLASVVTSPGRARPFRQEEDSPFPGTVVTLLIDHSGSMRGRPMLIAALTVEIFARVLERCGVRCEVLGFTTRDWDGGQPARDWAANGYPDGPGRLNALEHIIVKAADVPWRRARLGLGLFLHDEMLKENIDGEALDWAHRRLLARPEPRKILIVVSDGTPMDEATMAANGHEYLEAHLQRVVAGIEARSPVQLAAIGIGHDVSLFYRNATTVAGIEQLGSALGSKLVALLGPAGRGRDTGRRRWSRSSRGSSVGEALEAAR